MSYLTECDAQQQQQLQYDEVFSTYLGLGGHGHLIRFECLSRCHLLYWERLQLIHRNVSYVQSELKGESNILFAFLCYVECPLHLTLYFPCFQSLDICVPEGRIERMRKIFNSPLLRRRNVSQHGHGPNCKQLPPSSFSSPSSSPALGSNSPGMKTFGVSLESLSHHQHPHHQQHQQNQEHYPEEYYVRDPEQIVVPHQKAAHILGQVCAGCLTSAPSNSSSMGSINETSTATSSGHFSQHASSHLDDCCTASSVASSIVASTSSSGTSSANSSNFSSSGPAGSPCVIPFIVTRLCKYLNDFIAQEGLFRISGNAKLVEKLKQSFDSTGDAPLETEGDLASAAALLKQFLRELPQPLIPNGLQFLDVIRCKHSP